jgi:hypothetical protein
MTAASATPAGAGQPGAGRAIGSESAIVLVESNTLPSVFCAIIGSVLYHVISPYKTTGQSAGNALTRLTRQMEAQVTSYVISYQYKAKQAKKESPQHKLAGDIATSGGVL